MDELIIQLYGNLGEYLSFSPSSFLKHIFYTTKKDHHFGCWHELPDGIMENIFLRLNLVDRVRSGGVCKSWRSVLVMQKRIGVHDPQLPWLLLPRSQSCKSLSFFSMSEEIVRNIKLPEAAEGGWCFGSSNGWLMMARGTEYEPEVLLVNPLSGFQLNLPSLATIFPYYYDHVDAAQDPERFASFIDKMIVSCGEPSEDCIVAAMMNNSKILAFCKPGDKEWSVWEGGVNYDDEESCFYLDIIFFEEKLFVLIGMEMEMEMDGIPAAGFGSSYSTSMEVENREVVLTVIPFSVSDIIFDPAVDIEDMIARENGVLERAGRNFNLVESGGELLMVVAFVDVHFIVTVGDDDDGGGYDDGEEEEYEDGGGYDDWDEEEYEEEDGAFCFVYFKTSNFGVYKVGCSTKLTSVGDKMLFLSKGESVSVSAADFKGYSGNLIYFLEDDDYRFEDDDPIITRESGVFYLDDERIERSSLSTLPRESLMCWFTPHISIHG